MLVYNGWKSTVLYSSLQLMLIYAVSIFLSGARISVGDGTLTILAKNQSIMDKVQEKVLFHLDCLVYCCSHANLACSLCWDSFICSCTLHQLDISLDLQCNIITNFNFVLSD